MMLTRLRVACAAAAAGAVLATGLAACGATPGSPASTGARGSMPATSAPAASQTAAAPGQAPSATAPAAPSASSPRASAVGQLTAYLTAAGTADAQLKYTAVMVNQLIGPDVIRFSAAEVNAVKAARAATDAAGKAIPAGLSPELLRRALLAYSDLESRTDAFARVVRRSQPSPPLPRDSDEGRDFMAALGHGAPAAARFASDLAAVGDLAAATAPGATAAPDSRAAAEVAVRITQIRLANSGCDSTGGQLFTTLHPLTWHPAGVLGTDIRSDGTIDGTPFSVTYHPGSGWTALIYAC